MVSSIKCHKIVTSGHQNSPDPKVNIFLSSQQIQSTIIENKEKHLTFEGLEPSVVFARKMTQTVNLLSK